MLLCGAGVVDDKALGSQSYCSSAYTSAKLELLQHDCEPNALVRFTSEFGSGTSGSGSGKNVSGLGFAVELLALGRIKKGEACLIDYIDLDEAYEDYFSDELEEAAVGKEEDKSDSKPKEKSNEDVDDDDDSDQDELTLSEMDLRRDELAYRFGVGEVVASSCQVCLEFKKIILREKLSDAAMRQTHLAVGGKARGKTGGAKQRLRKGGNGRGRARK